MLQWMTEAHHVSVITNLPDNDSDVIDGLIVRIAEGDRDALGELYALTSKGVYSYSLSILRSCHDAEDVLHDTYIAVMKYAERYRSSGKPMAWIITIAKNLCFMKLRERKKTADTEDDDLMSVLVPDSASLTPEERVILTECMNELSEEERRIVVLHAVSGLRHREIAAITGIALPTVLSKYSRALKKLRKSLTEGDS